MDQRIDQFINKSENVCNNNIEAKPYIQNSVGELKRYWNNLKKQANELRQSIDSTKQYFATNEQVNSFYNYSNFILTHHIKYLYNKFYLYFHCFANSSTD